MIEEHYYTLELDLDSKPNGHMRVYGRGICPTFFEFQHMKQFRILRYTLVEHDYKRKDLTNAFLCVQRQFKKRLLVRKKAVRFLRKRELGLAHPRELSRYLE